MQRAAEEEEGGRRGDAAETLAVLQRFHPRARQAMTAVAGLAFLSGLAEGGVLALITMVAVSLTEDAGRLELGPVTATPTQVIVFAAGLLMANIVMVVLQASLVARVVANASLRARRDLLEVFHRASFERKSKDRVAGLQEASTTYVDRFGMSFVQLAALIVATLNLLSYAVLALSVNPLAASVLAVMGAVLVVAFRPISKRTKQSSKELQEARTTYVGGLTESVLLARELAVFGSSAALSRRLKGIDAQVASAFRRARFLATVTPRVYQALALGFALVALGALTTTGVSDLASLGAVVLLLLRSLSYGQQIVSALQQLAENRPVVDRMIADMDSYEASTEVVGDERLEQLHSIEMSGLTFTYDTGPADGTGSTGRSEAALSNVNLAVSRGETIGVIGPSGSGKSTLVNILLRLYPPTSGTYQVNGMAVTEFSHASWTSTTAIVPQEPRLLAGTIAENIDFLRGLDQSRIERAARQAHIHDFVIGLPKGYDTLVGELGAGLSGGQRQRICIARALAGEPELLVLDEPTSALDGESESSIQATLTELQGKVTMVIVAHRLSTLNTCDRLVVLMDGMVVEEGSPSDLAANSTYYRAALTAAGIGV